MSFNLIFYLGDLFKIWIETLFVIPIKNWDMLWLLVPVWLAWFFAEFFQEKIGTSMGNAMTNAVVILWGSVDCIRQTVNLIVSKSIQSTLDMIGRFALVAALFVYGVAIIRFGIKGNPIIKKIGRIRIITYVFAMFVPIFYNAISFSLNHFFATILFFPLFYFFIEGLDRIMPNPKAIIHDINEGMSLSKGHNMYQPTHKINRQHGKSDIPYSHNQQSNTLHKPYQNKSHHEMHHMQNSKNAYTSLQQK